MRIPRVYRRASVASLLVLWVIVPGTASAQTVGAGCFNLTATIAGTNDSDTITGTEGPDVIDGRGGNDVIDGLVRT
jgi:Ca2+-binding RTX toxin-like protein